MRRCATKIPSLLASPRLTYLVSLSTTTRHDPKKNAYFIVLVRPARPCRSCLLWLSRCRGPDRRQLGADGNVVLPSLLGDGERFCRCLRLRISSELFSGGDLLPISLPKGLLGRISRSQFLWLSRCSGPVWRQLGANEDVVLLSLLGDGERYCRCLCCCIGVTRARFPDRPVRWTCR